MQASSHACKGVWSAVGAVYQVPGCLLPVLHEAHVHLPHLALNLIDILQVLNGEVLKVTNGCKACDA
jgi:hypothetical protein